jgi:cell division septum initiation protein DivIVA
MIKMDNMKTFEQIAKEVYPDVDGYLDQIEHDRIQFIRGLEYSGQQTKDLQDKLSQKEFELKAADHVLAEKEKEIEILKNKLNNL